MNPFGVQVGRVYGHHFGGQERMHAEQQALQVLTYQFLIEDKNTKSIKKNQFLMANTVVKITDDQKSVLISYKTLQYSLQIAMIYLRYY